MISTLQKGNRSRVLASLVIITMSIFVVRLFYLQIIKHDYYTSIADNEQIKILTIPAKRGLIYALDGDKPVSLVMNQNVYTLIADPTITTDNSKIIDVIKRVAGGNTRPNLQDLLNTKNSRYQILATKLTRIQADKIKQENLAGISFHEVSQRVYPEGSLAAQTIGFVNDAGDGLYGVEGGLNDRLTGKPGLLKSVTDVRDVPLTLGNKNINIPAQNGDNIVLTIDRNVQSYAEQALQKQVKAINAKHGAVIVMDPSNGHVMAMAAYPSYNPAEFYKVKDAVVFSNPVISNAYEVASVAKNFSMGLGVDTGTIRPTDTYNNTDYVKIGVDVISNATLGQTGKITFQHAMTWSLNTGSTQVFQRLGDGKDITKEARDTIYDYYYNKFRLGRLTGVELAGESAGEIISPDDPSGEGSPIRYANMSFGQGMNVTMIQVAAAFSSLINGGEYQKPTVVAGTIADDGTYNPVDNQQPLGRTVSEATSLTMKKMVRDARNAFYTRYDKSGYDIGGKTGTGQVVVNGIYSPDESTGTYIGYGGEKNKTPRYVIMTEVWGHDQIFAGNWDAMPIFNDISNWLIDYLRLKPKG